MKCDRFTVAFVATMLGVATQGSFAQQMPNAPRTDSGSGVETIATNKSPALTSATTAPVSKSRQDVMRELEEFQTSGDAARLRELNRGGN